MPPNSKNSSAEKCEVCACTFFILYSLFLHFFIIIISFVIIIRKGKNGDDVRPDVFGELLRDGERDSLHMLHLLLLLYCLRADLSILTVFSFYLTPSSVLFSSCLFLLLIDGNIIDTILS